MTLPELSGKATLNVADFRAGIQTILSDLKKVADITMRWAIANSSASAGVLGLVVGEAPNQHLQIVSTYGYSDKDAPDGADGSLWPLDRGIVSRVMRTRQPDLANDVKIDPSYIPSLRSSLSQLTIPMLSGGEINALLVLEKDVEPRLNLLDLAFAQRLASRLPTRSFMLN